MTYHREEDHFLKVTQSPEVDGLQLSPSIGYIILTCVSENYVGKDKGLAEKFCPCTADRIYTLTSMQSA